MAESSKNFLINLALLDHLLSSISEKNINRMSGLNGVSKGYRCSSRSSKDYNSRNYGGNEHAYKPVGPDTGKGLIESTYSSWIGPLPSKINRNLGLSLLANDKYGGKI